MVTEAKTLRKEIARIAADYDLEWKGELENLKEKPIPTHHSASRSDVVASRPDESGQMERAGSESEDTELDIDDTIDEADELASQTEERRVKDKLRQRKGELADEPNSKAKERGREHNR